MEEKVEKELSLRDLLFKIYYDPEKGYRSADNLYRVMKEEYPHIDITKNFVKNWLLKQSAHTRFKKWNKPKHYRHTIVRDFDQLQMDLVVMIGYSGENQGYQYILSAIEILSRYAFATPIRTKSAKDTLEGIRRVVDDFSKRFDRKVEFIQFDEGKEFENKYSKEFFVEKGIRDFTTNSPRKASIVERFNRTLRTKMMKMFEHKGNHNWVEFLNELVAGYNNTIHRSIGMKPKDVNEENKFTVWMRLYGKLMSLKKPKYKIGDRVRVLKLNIQYRVAQLKGKYRIDAKEKDQSEKLFGDKFREKYKEKDEERVTGKQNAVAIKRPPFSTEIFDISDVLLGDPVVYKLYSDEFKKKVLGIFYEEELSLEEE